MTSKHFGTLLVDFCIATSFSDFDNKKEEVETLIQQKKCHVWLNEKEVDFRRGGNIQGEDGICAVLIISPGNPGKKKLKIQIGAWSAQTVLDYQPASGIVIYGPADGEGIFGPDPPSIEFDGYYLDATSIAATVNGQPVKTQVGLSGLDNCVAHAKILSTLCEGENSLTIKAVDFYGNSVTSDATFYFYPNNRVHMNDRFFLRTGRIDSRSGPFYQIAIQGGALTEVLPVESSDITRWNKNWTMDEYQFKCLKAVKKGKCLLTISEQVDFRGKELKEVRKIPIEVLP